MKTLLFLSLMLLCSCDRPPPPPWEHEIGALVVHKLDGTKGIVVDRQRAFNNGSSGWSVVYYVRWSAAGGMSSTYPWEIEPLNKTQH